jgi:hypothetical protein
MFRFRLGIGLFLLLFHFWFYHRLIDVHMRAALPAYVRGAPPGVSVTLPNLRWSVETFHNE